MKRVTCRFFVPDKPIKPINSGQRIAEVLQKTKAARAAAQTGWAFN